MSPSARQDPTRHPASESTEGPTPHPAGTTVTDSGEFRFIVTSQEAAAFWSELQRAVSQVGVLRQPPTWRRRRTGEMRVTRTERRAMQAFHLPNGDNYSRIARQFRRDRHHMPRWIWTNDYRAFHVYYWSTNGHADVTE